MSRNCERIEYITIVGNSFDEVADECRARHLSERQYSVVGPIGRHHIAVAGAEGAGTALNGQNLVTTTFARRVQI